MYEENLIFLSVCARTARELIEMGAYGGGEKVCADRGGGEWGVFTDTKQLMWAIGIARYMHCLLLKHLRIGYRYGTGTLQKIRMEKVV
jgi:hypothetical protein